MLLFLASCGIPPEAQETQPEELEGSRTQALSVDLDGDGTDESVTYRRTAGGFELAIDGKELGEELAAAGLGRRTPMTSASPWTLTQRTVLWR